MGATYFGQGYHEIIVRQYG